MLNISLVKQSPEEEGGIPGHWGCGVSWRGTEPHRVLPSRVSAGFQRGKALVCTTFLAREPPLALAQNMLKGNLRL